MPPSTDDAPRTAPRGAWTLQSTAPASGPRCKRHPESAATARCDRCKLAWCSFCVKQGEAMGMSFLACGCGGRCTPLESAAEIAARRTFEQDLVDVFRYPWRGEGRGIFVVGAIFVLVVDLIWGSAVRHAVQSLPWLGSGVLGGYAAAGSIYSGVWATVVIALVAGYLVSHLMRVVHETAADKDEPPGFPEFTSIGESMLLPLFRAFAALAVAFGPGLLCIALPGAAPMLGVPLMFVGAFYLPMAVTAIAISESLDGLSPRLVYRSIRRIPIHYCFAGSLFTAALGMLVFGAPLLDRLPFVGMPARAALLVYLIVVSGRVLGLLYRHHREELGWY